MPSRISNDAHREKDWSFDDLSKKEQAAYREKEKSYDEVRTRREKAEDDWRKGKISSDNYLKLDKEYADQEHKVLYPNSPRCKQNSKEKEVKKMAKEQGTVDEKKFEYKYKHPKSRAAQFVTELRGGTNSVTGKPLTEKDKARRSGYLLAQKDNAELFKKKQKG